MKRDTVIGTFVVAALVCVVCSLLVSSAAVGLRPRQVDNRILEKQRNILAAAGLLSKRDSDAVNQAFARIEVRVVDLATGQYVETGTIDPAAYDQVAAARDPHLSVSIPPEKDLAGIKRRVKYALVYLVKNDAGEVDQIVLPVNGMGLWSTLYGFLAIDRDLNTVRGLTFYEHAETPGLGGEVDNPNWKSQWQGKLLFDESGNLQIRVLRGTVQPGSPQAAHQVDGLSGATITSRGVTNLLHYWLGDDGFGPYLKVLRAEWGAHDGKS